MGETALFYSSLPRPTNLGCEAEITDINGAIAQLGERLPCTQEVSGSIPLSSTISDQGLEVSR